VAEIHVVQLTRVCGEIKLLVEDSDDNRSPDMSLLRIVTRAHEVQRLWIHHRLTESAGALLLRVGAFFPRNVSASGNH
jgi:hypothetical protein